MSENAQLAERIDKVDRFYSDRLKKLDEFYGKRIDHLLDQVAMLQNAVDNLPRRIDNLERK